MRISDWSSDVCSSDLTLDKNSLTLDLGGGEPLAASKPQTSNYSDRPYEKRLTQSGRRFISVDVDANLLEILDKNRGKLRRGVFRSEEHPSELQSLMRISYAVFSLTTQTKTYKSKNTNKH